MRARIIVIAVLALAVGGTTARDASPFALEDVVSGTRYHYNQTVAGAKNAGFSSNAAKMMAWVNDTLDVLLNNGTDVRDWVLHEWDKVHFDDLFDTAAVRMQWRRYMSGAFYGLLWCAETASPTIAMHILGVLTHAVQDFYAHSTWVNVEALRDRTVQEASISEFDALDLWTGAYKHSPPAGRDVHGSNWKCSVQSQPAGIGLDSVLCSKKRIVNRRLAGASASLGETLFANANALATRSTEQTLRLLGKWMAQAGKSGFWSYLKSYSDVTAPAPSTTLASQPPSWSYLGDTQRVRTWFPVGFLSGGRYGSGSGWHFRIEIETSDGTDGEVSFRAGDKTFLIDRVNYDDFEAGDHDVYHVGPVTSFPSSISLRVKGGGITGKWKGKVKVWAYRIGATAKYAMVVDQTDTVTLSDTSKSWAVTEPTSPGFSLGFRNGTYK
jgi:hypothetical protein